MSATTENTKTISDRNGHGRCLLCGNRNPISLGLSFTLLGDGGVASQFSPGAELQGYDGFLHGGMISSLLDAAMTHCLFHQGIQAVTGDLHVRFLHPVPIGAVLDVHAWILSSYPPLHRLKGEIKIGERITAWAEAKFMECDILQ